MTATLDTHPQQQDDLSHDTLMGLQELDSHLAIFESSHPGMESSVSGLTSSTMFDTAFDMTDDPSQTIIVESPNDFHLRDREQRTILGLHADSMFSGTNPSNTKAENNLKQFRGNSQYINSEGTRDSIASSMATDPDEASSFLSSISSKATSPTEFEGSLKETIKSVASPKKRRQKYNVRPKISIPTDISPSEYARQCIFAAESSRLNPYSLHSEELALLRDHISHQQVTTYLHIRNGILRLWSRNPLIRVMRDEAVGCAKDARWFDVANVCYEWLVRRGYINFGCIEHTEVNPSKKARQSKKRRRTVTVIGAGMSGLGCARQLEGLFSQFEERFQEMGEDIPRVVVLEGRDRVGGRICSKAFKSESAYPSLRKGSRHTSEMGGMIITGFDRGNPLNILVRAQLALSYHALRSETTIYDATGKPVDIERDQHAEKLFNYILDRVSEYKFKIHQPVVVNGNRNYLNTGRDVTGEGQKTISEIGDVVESPKDSNSRSIKIQMIPVASDRLTGGAHFEPGIPSVHTAAYKAQEIGWQLKPGVRIEFDLDLEAAVKSKYATLGSVFEEAIAQYTRIIDFTPLDLRLINWHVANLEYSNATTINRLSLGGWDLDAGNEWEGKHTMIRGGFQQVPRGLLNFPQPLDVRKSSAVKLIVHNPGNADALSKVECENGQAFDTDYIVSTIPLGVLKQESLKFEPTLPEWKAGAIQRLGYGILNKVVLVFREPFWDETRDIFGTLRDPQNITSLSQKDYFSPRGRFFQWFNCTSTTGLPTLLALMAGDAAFYTEKTSNEALIDEATAVLRSVFGPTVPKPIESIVTRWGQDKFARGSYSYTGPSFQPDDYTVMAKPVGNLFFAGEHTCGTHPATVHGAYISGLRAASEVLDAILGPIGVPEPLVLPKDSGLKRKADEVGKNNKDPKEARLEAYEAEIWAAMQSKLGDRPWLPPKNKSNPYRMYSKDRWEDAKRKCEEGRRPGKGKPISNEVKKMVTKMWNEASTEEKKPYIEKANALKQQSIIETAESAQKLAKWDQDAFAFRAEYVLKNPSMPGPDEKIDSPSRRARRARRVNGYAEDSGSDVEV